MATRVAAIVDSVTIINQKVPAAVLNGSDSVLLDCVYKVHPADTAGLVITWYFNNSPSPSYQWIPGHPPRTIGAMGRRVRLGYKVSDDALTAYRAMYIAKPTIELTGNYKCVVSTFSDEDFMIKKMIVYGESRGPIGFTFFVFIPFIFANGVIKRGEYCHFAYPFG